MSVIMQQVAASQSNISQIFAVVDRIRANVSLLSTQIDVINTDISQLAAVTHRNVSHMSAQLDATNEDISQLATATNLEYSYVIQAGAIFLSFKHRFMRGEDRWYSSMKWQSH